jgi:hypothetical protein
LSYSAHPGTEFVVAAMGKANLDIFEGIVAINKVNLENLTEGLPCSIRLSFA